MPATLTNRGTESPKSWKQQPDTYSADSVINAYLQGRKDGSRSEYEKILIDQFGDNLIIVANATENLIDKVGKLGIKFRSLHLRADSISSFTILGIVEEKDFLDDKFRSVFTHARAIKKECSKNNVYFSFTFMPFSSNLNESCLTSDGYAWKYAKNSGTA